MPNTYRIVEQILEEQAEAGRFDIYFTTIDSNNVNGEGALETITDYVEEHLDLNYSDINGAPALPEDTENQSPAYEGEVGARQIKGLQEVAFTGDYNSLKNKIKVPVDTNNESPAYELILDENNNYIRQLKPLSELAFSGEVNTDNLQVAKVVNLINMTINNQTNEDFSNLGAENIFIDDSTESVKNIFASALQDFHMRKRPTFFVTTSGCYFVLNASIMTIEVPNSAPAERGYKFELALVNDTVISGVFTTGGIHNIANLETTLANEITLSNVRQVVFIYDLYDHGIYCKVRALADVASSGKYNDLIEKPTIITNYSELSGKPILDASAVNTDITGLAGVAISGSYDDLTDSYYVLDFSKFVYKYNSQENTYIETTAMDLSILLLIGMDNGYKTEINQYYKRTEDNEYISLIDSLQELVEAFNAGKICYIYILQQGGQYQLVTNIFYTPFNPMSFTNFEDMTSITISCTPMVLNNFSSLLTAPAGNTTQIQAILDNLTMTVSAFYISIDLDKNILYSKIQRIDNHYISSNANNILQMANDGLCVIDPTV